MSISIYLYKKTVIIPSRAETERGTGLESEPVATVEATDRTGIIRALVTAATAPRALVPSPPLKGHKPVVLKYAKLPSWSQFVKAITDCWLVENIGKGYVIIPYRWGPRGSRVYENVKMEPIPIEELAGQIADSIGQRVSG